MSTLITMGVGQGGTKTSLILNGLDHARQGTSPSLNDVDAGYDEEPYRRAKRKKKLQLKQDVRNSMTVPHKPSPVTSVEPTVVNQPPPSLHQKPLTMKHDPKRLAAGLLGRPGSNGGGLFGVTF